MPTTLEPSSAVLQDLQIRLEQLEALMTRTLTAYEERMEALKNDLRMCQRTVNALWDAQKALQADCTTLAQQLEQNEPVEQFFAELFQRAATEDNLWTGIKSIVHILEPQGSGKGPLMKEVSSLCKRPFKLY